MTDRIKRALAALVVALVAATGLVAVTGAPASAAYGDCPNEEMCTFDNVNGGGFMYRYGVNVFGGCTRNGRHATTSSITNRRSGSRVKFWGGEGCTLLTGGAETTWQYYGANLNLGYLLNDQMYSFRWESCAGLSACRY